MMPDRTIYCTDGLSALDVVNIEKVYHFGENIVFQDCGAPYENEWSALKQSAEDMYHMSIEVHSQVSSARDFRAAYLTNIAKHQKLTQTDVQIAGDDEHELQF